MIRPRLLQILRFLISGGTATAVNFSLLYALTEFAHIWYLTSFIIAFCAGLAVSFTLQKFWTFVDMNTDRMRAQIGLYFSVQMGNLGFNTVALFLLVEYAHLWYMAAQFMIAVVIACINFVLFKFVVFKQQEL